MELHIFQQYYLLDLPEKLDGHLVFQVYGLLFLMLLLV